jgi:hypothetical protein
LLSPAHNKSKNMVGIVEADETFFTEYFKGSRHIEHCKAKKRGKSKKNIGERVPVLIVRDRSGTEADFVFTQISKEKIHDALRPIRGGEEIILCTDGNGIYKSFAKAERIPHKRIVGLSNTYVVDKIFHIQNLNAYISRLKTWMRRFNGVATRYLENYLGWRRMIENKSEVASPDYYLRQALG